PLEALMRPPNAARHQRWEGGKSDACHGGRPGEIRGREVRCAAAAADPAARPRAANAAGSRSGRAEPERESEGASGARAAPPGERASCPK
ncbi:hypothetical protein THAOC_37082, partial [Thalassiosira oceanica]